MFAGHIGAALAIGRAERRINPGVFVLAGLFLDLVLWLFVLLGWESVAIPADFAATHQPEFVFPWSHGLGAALAWSCLAGLATFVAYRPLQAASLRAALLMGAAVFSHWLLDALVHAPELPLLGAGSSLLGLGLWNHMPAALGVEAALTGAGLGLYLSAAPLSRARKLCLSVLTGVSLLFTIAGMTVAPSPPSVTAMASSSLLSIVVVCALAAWAGKRA